MANGLQRIGLALGGLGAGLTGQLPAFQRTQAQLAQAEADRLQQQQLEQKQLDEGRRQALLVDNRVVLDHLRKGRAPQAVQLLQNRLGAIQQLGGDPSNTQNLLQQVQQGDIQGAIQQSQIVDDEAVIRGLLPEMEEPPQRKFIKAEKGRATFLNPDGTVSEEAVLGARVGAPGEEKLEFKDIRSVNKDVGALISDSLKVKSSASSLEKLSKTKSATDQLAAIFTFMKSLDPTSVVREGEQQQARSTGGLSDQLIGFVNRIKGEGALPPSVFNNMVRTAKRIANQSIADTRDNVDGFLNAFEGSIPPSQMAKLSARVPTAFEIGQEKPDDSTASVGSGFEEFRSNFIRDTGSPKGVNKEWRRLVDSPSLGRKVSIAEIYQRAKRKGITPEEERQNLGVSGPGQPPSSIAAPQPVSPTQPATQQPAAPDFSQFKVIGVQ